MRIRVLSVAVLMIGFLALPAGADTKLVRKSTTSGAAMMGQPDGEVTSTIWIGKGRLSQDDGSRGMILDLEAKKLIMVNHSTKSYTVLSLPIRIMELVPKEMLPMFEQMNIEVNVTPGEQEKQIGEFATKLYTVEIKMAMGSVTQILWVTKDIEMDYAAYREMALEMASIQALPRESIEKMMAIEGFPVVSENTVAMMGGELTTREELISAATEDAPKGIYAPPADYTEKEFDFMSVMQGRR